MNVSSRSLRACLPAAVIAVGVYLCFLHKAFNIDDHVFLAMAKHMLEDPLHPASVLFVNNGRPPVWISAGMWSGPVMPTLLVPAVAAGGAEWLAHLTMLLVFLVGIFSTAAMALRLGISDAGARWAALLVTTSAAVLAMASTSMPDLPTMSFAVLGVERLLAYRSEGGWWRWCSGVLGLTLCMLSRQHGALVFPCALLLMITAWSGTLHQAFRAVFNRTYLMIVAAMFVAVALVFVTYAVMSDSQHSGLTSTPTHVADYTLWRANLPNIPAQWVLSFPLGLAWAWIHRQRMPRSWWCWLAAIAGVWLAYQTHVFHRHKDWMPWQGPVTALGTAVLVDIVVDAVRRRDPIDLGLAGWLLIALPVAVYSHLPPKYLVPSAPAMAVLIMRAVERRDPTARTMLRVLVVQGLVLGLLIIRADQTHGEVGRRGGEVVASYVARGERVWFDGTWGFQWYAMQAGARPVTTQEPRPGPGDIVVGGQENWIVKQWPNKQLIETVTFEPPWGRILLKPAGFFSNVAWGPLPWRWSRTPYKPVQVWRIE